MVVVVVVVVVVEIVEGDGGALGTDNTLPETKTPSKGKTPFREEKTTGNKKHYSRYKKPAAHSRYKVRGRRSEVRSPGSEVRGPGVRGSRFEVRGSRFEVRGPRSEVRGPRSEVRGSRLYGAGVTIAKFDLQAIKKCVVLQYVS